MIQKGKLTAQCLQVISAAWRIMKIDCERSLQKCERSQGDWKLRQGLKPRKNVPNSAKKRHNGTILK
jgi:hypothetical protein